MSLSVRIQDAVKRYGDFYAVNLISKIYRTHGGQAYNVGDTVDIALPRNALTLYTEDGKEALS